MAPSAAESAISAIVIGNYGILCPYIGSAENGSAPGNEAGTKHTGGRYRRKPMRDCKKELQEIISRTDEAKRLLADLVLYLDSEDKDVDSLDEALEALDDAIDILEDYTDEEE